MIISPNTDVEQLNFRLTLLQTQRADILKSLFHIKSADQQIHKQFPLGAHPYYRQTIFLPKLMHLCFVIHNLVLSSCTSIMVALDFQPGLLFITTFCCRLPDDSSCLGVLLLPAVNWTLAHFVALLHCIIVLVSMIFFYLRTEKLALRTMLMYYHIKR